MGRESSVIRVITGMGQWKQEEGEDYKDFRMRANKESAEIVRYLGKNSKYKIIANTNKCLHVKQWMPGYPQWNFSWKIEKDIDGYITDITENKHEKTAAEYPARWGSLDKTLWEYETYTYPFLFHAIENDIPLNIKGMRETRFFSELKTPICYKDMNPKLKKWYSQD